MIDIYIYFFQMNVSDVSVMDMISFCWAHFVVSTISIDDRVYDYPFPDHVTTMVA